MTLDVVTLGPLNVDLMIIGRAPIAIDELTHWIGPSQVTMTAAGSNGYTTLALARLGLKTGVVSQLANDTLGEFVYQEMRIAGVDVSRVSRQTGALSGIGIYILLFGSKKRPLTYRLPTHDPWPRPLSAADKEYLLSGRHLHCGGYLHFPEMWNADLAEVYRAAQARGITTSLDPQGVLGSYAGPWIEPVREALKYTDLLMLDAVEAMRLAESDDLSTAALTLQRTGPRVVAIKNSADGTLVCTGEHTFHQAAIPVPDEEIVEMVGAGDTFDAGLIAGFLTDWPIEKAVRFASLVAASSLRGSGAVSSLASREKLEQMLNAT